jgi:hypothetical protein
MKQLIALAAIAATLAMPIAAQAQAKAQDSTAPAPITKGGDCVELVGQTESQFNCNHLGLVKNAREIYEKGFKIIAAFNRGNARYFIIEQQ